MDLFIVSGLALAALCELAALVTFGRLLFEFHHEGRK